jgi:ribonuclease BN (tRNA processing enzyme)
MNRKSTTQLVLLGTGTPNAEPHRAGSAGAIIVNETPYLIDFGPGVIRRAAAAYQQGVQALAPQNLTTAFLTRLHSDHTAGYSDLILTPWVLRRDRPLQVLLLVLSHQLHWGQSEEGLLREIKTHYRGAVVSAKDLDVFELDARTTVSAG